MIVLVLAAAFLGVCALYTDRRVMFKSTHLAPPCRAYPAPECSVGQRSRETGSASGGFSLVPFGSGVGYPRPGGYGDGWGLRGPVMDGGRQYQRVAGGHSGWLVDMAGRRQERGRVFFEVTSVVRANEIGNSNISSQVKNYSPVYMKQNARKKQGRGLPTGRAGCAGACGALAAGRLRGLSVRARARRDTCTCAGRCAIYVSVLFSRQGEATGLVSSLVYGLL